ncbi:MAG: DNA alkylation response protein, partial [Alphaproteobacteria bacterium]
MTGFLEDASFNQSPPFGDVDLFSTDKPLSDAAARCGLDLKALAACGKDYGSAETLDLGRVANENPPKLKTMDGRGNRTDFVEFHPAYHALMQKSIGWGIHSGAHDGSEPTAPLTSRAVRLYLATQAESGHLCSITMTHACIGALKSEPELLKKWQAKIVSRDYDRRPLPWWKKKGVTLGMGMTERQGGTDVRANITEAVPISSGKEGDHVEISGHKWFMSAPMCDAFLVLAQAQNGEKGGGLTCYLMPRYRPDGSQNAIRFQRLKDKLGNKSNASSEVEFHGAYAERVGAEGQGVRTIIEMVNLTRLDCAIASAGQMRFGLSQALNHIRNRSVFQRRLADQPSMRAVVADLALELEAQVALVFRLAHAVDKGDTAYSRLLTPAIKYLICKSTPAVVYESLECLGGNGYTEDLPMARLYREAPLNAIWEGSGNVMALDVLRAAGRAPDATMETVGALVHTASQAFDVRPLAVALEKTLKSP